MTGREEGKKGRREEGRREEGRREEGRREEEKKGRRAFLVLGEKVIIGF
jgi:hypothetical protein